MLFAIMLAVRVAPWITALNMLAMLGLLMLHATLYRAERLSQLELDGWRIGVGMFIASITAVLLPLGLVAKQSGNFAERGGLRRSLVFIRGGLFATPILLLFTGLLAAADSIFASYLDDLLRWQFALELPLFSQVIGSILIAWGVAGELLIALRDDDRDVS
ncbi:MAG: DUF4153 domain-containing protein [Oscillochloridaceae bacterium umkhey_bin13]